MQSVTKQYEDNMSKPNISFILEQIISSIIVMSGEDYTRAIRYEFLVRNAFDCARGNRNGADVNFMKNAMSMEKEKVSLSI